MDQLNNVLCQSRISIDTIGNLFSLEEKSQRQQEIYKERRKRRERKREDTYDVCPDLPLHLHVQRLPLCAEFIANCARMHRTHCSYNTRIPPMRHNFWWNCSRPLVKIHCVRIFRNRSSFKNLIQNYTIFFITFILFIL